MPVACALGLHSWVGCQCSRCDRARDVEHRWAACKCEVCGKTRDAEHRWTACRCEVCGKTRDTDHRWSACKCEVCGKEGHQWQGCRCARCGRTRDVSWAHSYNSGGPDRVCRVCGAREPNDKAAQQWVGELRDAGDYRAMAAYLCSYRSGDDVDRWNAKRRHALATLRDAGSEGVEAMLLWLEHGEDKDYFVARLLVELGDTRAVRLLQKLSDRGQWDAIGGHEAITDFVNRYPELHGAVERTTCPICGTARPVSETKPSGDQRFCEGSCWSKRGRVIEHGIGRDCPHYDEGVCMAGGTDTGLCSLQAGTHRTFCHVYAMYPQ